MNFILPSECANCNKQPGTDKLTIVGSHTEMEKDGTQKSTSYEVDVPICADCKKHRIASINKATIFLCVCWALIIILGVVFLRKEPGIMWLNIIFGIVPSISLFFFMQKKEDVASIVNKGQAIKFKNHEYQEAYNKLNPDNQPKPETNGMTIFGMVIVYGLYLSLIVSSIQQAVYLWK